MRWRRWRVTIAASATALLAGIIPAVTMTTAHAASSATNPLKWGLCSGYNSHGADCTDVSNAYPPSGWGGAYVGHDEPSVLFYSNHPGSGNNDTYTMRLPAEPRTPPKQDGTGGTANFELHPAFWFGMASPKRRPTPLARRRPPIRPMPPETCS
jgi:hypothetical protein